MPFYDTTAQNAALDSLWGAAHGSTMPTTFEVGLLNGDPTDAGTELASTGGYARITASNNGTTWPGAVDGSSTTAPLSFADATGPWSDTATHWAIYVSGGLFDYGRLADPVTVTAAGPVQPITLTVYFNPDVAA